MNNFNDYLQHHGVKGMKWGVRKYRNSDGSLTPQGNQRYSRKEKREIKKFRKEEYNKAFKEEYDRRGGGRQAAVAITNASLLSTMGAGVPFLGYNTALSGLKYISTVKASKVHARKTATKKVTERYGKKIARELNRKDTINGMIFAAGAGLIAAELLKTDLARKNNYDTNWGFKA